MQMISQTFYRSHPDTLFGLCEEKDMTASGVDVMLGLCCIVDRIQSKLLMALPALVHNGTSGDPANFHVHCVISHGKQLEVTNSQRDFEAMEAI